MPISFTHIINPFVSAQHSEHGIASRITNASLKTAVDAARQAGIEVEIKAVILPGDEAAIHAPAQLGGYLHRTVQDIRALRPKRSFPLIADILKVGSASASGSHLIFTNMDIAVQPDFYVQLRTLIDERFDMETPFIVYRRNIPRHFTAVEQLPKMYAEPGETAYGFDCFVFPSVYATQLDLGLCCIGAAHFDYLMFMALDAASGFRMRRVNDVPLTFHIGNDISWSGQIDYIEHNLAESMAAIQRMRQRYVVPNDGQFDRLEHRHFRPNARIDSRILRKLKRLPGFAQLSVPIKRWMGRSH
jgi:hypothetical protein